MTSPSRRKCPICGRWAQLGTSWGFSYWKKGEDILCGCFSCKQRSIDGPGLGWSIRKCPMCGKREPRQKCWVDGEKILHGCIYCYMNYVKMKKGESDNNDPDDIL
jgi:hypothetical protein